MPNPSNFNKTAKNDQNYLNRSRKVFERPQGEPSESSASGQKTDNEAITGQATKAMPAETGGPEGPEPTRYGDWEKKGRCIDF